MKCPTCKKTTGGKNAAYCMFCGKKFKGETKKYAVTLTVHAEMTSEEIRKILN